MEPSSSSSEQGRHAARSSANDDDIIHWEASSRALEEALRLGTAERTAYFKALQARDPAFAEEIRELLALSEDTGGILDQPSSRFISELIRGRDDNGLEGHIVGAFRIGRRIGSGGMSDVYLGERTDGAYVQRVAVKVLRVALPSDADISRFQRERQILANLEHVNLARILDGGLTERGAPYFLMELVDGIPIDEYCALHKATVTARLSLLRTVCNVVHYVNQHGIVHRDLKPRNILVTPDGVVKLLDFGIAKRLDDQVANIDHTLTALRSMTLLYASPEQVRGESVLPTSDVYALGVVTYKLLTQRFPYSLDIVTSSTFELARAICEEEPRPMSEVGEADDSGGALKRVLRGDLDAIVSKALRKEPAARYRSAEELSDDFFRYQCALPVQARRGTWGYRIGRWLVKHRALALTAIVANVVLLVSLTISLEEVHESRLQRTRAEQNLASVRKLANVFLFEFDDKIAPLPGSIEARRFVVKTAQDYLTSLAAEATSDPALTLDLAISYRKVGEIQGRRDAPNLGDLAGALASFDRSIALLNEFLLKHPDVTLANQARFELARALARKAIVLHDQGNYSSAEDLFRQVEFNLTEVLRHDPDNVDALTFKATAVGWHGWLRLQQKDIPSFEKYSALSETMLKDLFRRRPYDPSIMGGLATVYARSAIWQLERDDGKRSGYPALPPLYKWIELERELNTREPNNPRFASGLAEAYNYLGRALHDIGRNSEAIVAMRNSIALLDNEMRRAPDDAMTRNILMLAHITLASMYLDQKDTTGAITYSRLALSDYKLLPVGEQKADNQLDDAEAHYIAGRAYSEIYKKSVGVARANVDARTSCREFAESWELIRSSSQEAISGHGSLDSKAVQQGVRDCNRSVSDTASRKW